VDAATLGWRADAQSVAASRIGALPWVRRTFKAHEGKQPIKYTTEIAMRIVPFIKKLPL
jgi:hypothetical protein